MLAKKLSWSNSLSSNKQMRNMIKEYAKRHIYCLINVQKKRFNSKFGSLRHLYIYFTCILLIRSAFEIGWLWGLMENSKNNRWWLIMEKEENNNNNNNNKNAREIISGMDLSFHLSVPHCTSHHITLHYITTTHTAFLSCQKCLALKIYSVDWQEPMMDPVRFSLYYNSYNVSKISLW